MTLVKNKKNKCDHTPKNEILKGDITYLSVLKRKFLGLILLSSVGLLLTNVPMFTAVMPIVPKSPAPVEHDVVLARHAGPGVVVGLRVAAAPVPAGEAPGRAVSPAPGSPVPVLPPSCPDM